MSQATLFFGPFQLLSRQGPLLIEGQEVRLQPKALALLWTLASQPDVVVTKASLMDAVWPGVVVGEDALTFQMQALRRALDDDPKQPRYIATVHRLGYRFMAPVNAGSDATSASRPPAAPFDPLVGRKADMDALHAAFTRVLGGERQLVFVTGEAGLGKTRLANEFLSQLSQRHPDALVGRGQCLEHQGSPETYLPLLDALGHLLRHAADATPFDLVRRIAPAWLLQLPSLMSTQEHASLRLETRHIRNERMLRELIEALEQLSLSQPVVLVLEDLHWSDAPSIDLLKALGQRTHPARLLVVATYRPVDAILAQHPVNALRLALISGGRAQDLMLGYLDTPAVHEYLQKRVGAANVADDLSAALHRRSGGHPLYLARIVELLLAQGGDAAAELARVDSLLPPGLRDLIAFQISQLGQTEQLILEAASVAGMEFASASVAPCLGMHPDEVERRCDVLARHGRLIQDHGLAIWPDGTSSGRYRFGHELYVQVLQRAMSSVRRARLHRLIADRLEQAYRDRTHKIAGELVHHYEQAGLADKVVRYRIALAEIALERAAQDQVEIQTGHGLAWLDLMPADDTRDEFELTLRTLAVRALHARCGYHGAQAAPHLAAIGPLLQRVRQPLVMYAALGTLWQDAHFQGRVHQALSHAVDLCELGKSRDEPALQGCGHAFSSHTLHLAGRHREAEREAMLAIDHADAALQRQSKIDVLETRWSGQIALGMARWFLGLPDQALRAAQSARNGSATMRSPYTECLIATVGLGNLLMFRREWAALATSSVESRTLCERYGHEDGLLLCAQHHLTARCMLGEDRAALDELVGLLDQERNPGNVMRNPISGYVHAAEAALRMDDVALAQRLNDRAIRVLELHGARPWEPEAWRMNAMLLLSRSPERSAEAQACLERALAICRARECRMLELRSATALARLLHAQARFDQALALIRPLYASFTEGFDTPDLRETRALIRDLMQVTGSSPADAELLRDA